MTRKYAHIPVDIITRIDGHKLLGPNSAYAIVAARAKESCAPSMLAAVKCLGMSFLHISRYRAPPPSSPQTVVMNSYIVVCYAFVVAY